MKLFPLAPPPPESPTVMLSAGSFSSPYEHLSQPETKRMVEHYTAYLSDNTRLIANPGLKVRLPRVRPEPSRLFLSRPEKANKSRRPSPPPASHVPHVLLAVGVHSCPPRWGRERFRV